MIERFYNFIINAFASLCWIKPLSYRAPYPASGHSHTCARFFIKITIIAVYFIRVIQALLVSILTDIFFSRRPFRLFRFRWLTMIEGFDYFVVYARAGLSWIKLLSVIAHHFARCKTHASACFFIKIALVAITAIHFFRII